MSQFSFLAFIDNHNFLFLKMVIDFTATWCGPCKYMDPIIQEFAYKYTEVEFIKIDVDELMVLLIYFLQQLLVCHLIIVRNTLIHCTCLICFLHSIPLNTQNHWITLIRNYA